MAFSATQPRLKLRKFAGAMRSALSKLIVCRRMDVRPGVVGVWIKGAPALGARTRAGEY